MLTPEETSFIEYWAQKRTLKKTSLRQFAIGLPFGVLLVLALFINVLTGWHKTAAMAMQNNGSLIMVILIAGIAIVTFMTLFSQRYQWEQKEQRYQELLQKQKQSNDAAI